jgi:hypothetical protein
MAHRSTLLAVGFDDSLVNRQDWDLAVRLTASGGSMRHLDEPLSIWHHDPSRETVSRSGKWR